MAITHVYEDQWGGRISASLTLFADHHQRLRRAGILIDGTNVKMDPSKMDAR